MSWYKEFYVKKLDEIALLVIDFLIITIYKILILLN